MKSEIKMAVLAVISKKSMRRNRTIAATSLGEIKNDLKKYYHKDLTERHILNVIRELGRIIIKEKHPRNTRRTLHRINPRFVEEAALTLVKLGNCRAHKNHEFEGILCSPLVSTQKQKFLVINSRHP
jgi:hypothetical protein